MKSIKAYLFILFLLPTYLWSAVDFDLQVSSQSSDGEAIQLDVTVDITGDEDVEEPIISDSDEWAISGPSVRQSSQTTFINGDVKSSSRKIYIYQLLPQKTGNLKTPEITISVDGKEQILNQQTIKVAKLDPNKQKMPTGRGFQQQFGFGGRGNNNSNAFPWPDQDVFKGSENPSEVVIVGEPSKSEVYVGELIDLPFYIYYKGANISNFEFGKFPEFKGFLKEELNVPRHLRQERSVFNGQTMFRSEIIRYAVFPLKAGDLVIDPLKLRVEAMMSPQNFMEDVFRGNGFPSFALGRKKLEKSSGALPVTVKPLPELTEGQHFDGGVGDFSIEWTGPKGASAVVGQPFNVELTITGKGNIKAIEEPKINIPATLESFKTTNRYEFREDATGYKTFEYLFSPKQPGPMTIEGVHWTYFDPEKEDYVEIKTEDLQINVEGSPNNSLAQGDDSSLKDIEAPLFVLKQRDIGSVKAWVPETVWTYLSTTIWFVPGVLYLGYFLMFFKVKRDKKYAELYKNYPWIETEKKISELSSQDVIKICNLMDVWIRQRLIYMINDKSVKMHSSQEILKEALGTKLHPEEQSLVRELGDYWSELDLLRFAGKKAQKADLDQVFEKIQNKIEVIFNKFQKN